MSRLVPFGTLARRVVGPGAGPEGEECPVAIEASSESSASSAFAPWMSRLVSAQSTWPSSSVWSARTRSCTAAPWPGAGAWKATIGGIRVRRSFASKRRIAGRR
ncbi:MAG TPA: hypothetical protein DEF51_33390 [Myxococcales bacterium]|nr:hypothetical protein [Myxococcales bacterium]